MLWTALMLVWTTVAAVTDVLWHKIYNWNTYSGILLALGGSALGTALGLGNALFDRPGISAST